jgi:hypothetical protein
VVTCVPIMRASRSVSICSTSSSVVWALATEARRYPKSRTINMRVQRDVMNEGSPGQRSRIRWLHSSFMAILRCLATCIHASATHANALLVLPHRQSANPAFALARRTNEADTFGCPPTSPYQCRPGTHSRGPAATPPHSPIHHPSTTSKLSVNEWFPDVWSICNNSTATLSQTLLMAVWVVANSARVGRVIPASPCMGSFVGRSATATHDTNNNCGRVSTNRRKPRHTE